MGRDLSFRLIIMMGHGDVWIGTFLQRFFTDTVYRQQVQWSQVFQLEDLGGEDSGCMQGADSHGQSSAGPTG
jgi:hypothetical protein